MGAESSKHHQEGRLLTPTMYRKGYKTTPKSEPQTRSSAQPPAQQQIDRSNSPDFRSTTPSSLFTSRSRTYERYSPIDNSYRSERERIRELDYDATKNMEVMTLRKSPVSYERRIGGGIGFGSGSRESTLDTGTSPSAAREPLKQTNTNTTSTSTRELARTSASTPTPGITYSTPILTGLNAEDIARIRLPSKSSSSETGAGGGGGTNNTNAKDSSSSSSTTTTKPKYQYSSESKVEKIKSGATTTVQFTSLEKKSSSDITYSPLFYGHFACSKCTRVWTSRISQHDKPQACDRCDTLVLPTINNPATE